MPTTRVGFTQYGKPTFLIPSIFPQKPADAGTLLRDILLTFGPVIGLTPDDLAFFGARFWQILTSCEERRIGEYERVRLVGIHRRRGALGVLPEIPGHRLYALAGRRQGAQGQRAHRRRHVRADDADVPQSDGGSDRSPVRRADQFRVDRSVAAAICESKGVHYLRKMEVEQILCDNLRVTGVAVRQQGQADGD